MIAYTLLTKIRWQQIRSSTRHVLLVCLLLLVPLVFSMAHDASLKSTIARECVRPKVVYVAKEVVIPSSMQALPTDAPTTLYIPKYLPTSSITWALKVVPMTCK